MLCDALHSYGLRIFGLALATVRIASVLNSATTYGYLVPVARASLLRCFRFYYATTWRLPALVHVGLGGRGWVQGAHVHACGWVWVCVCAEGRVGQPRLAKQDSPPRWAVWDRLVGGGDILWAPDSPRRTFVLEVLGGEDACGGASHGRWRAAPRAYRYAPPGAPGQHAPM